MMQQALNNAATSGGPPTIRLPPRASSGSQKGQIAMPTTAVKNAAAKQAFKQRLQRAGDDEEDDEDDVDYDQEVEDDEDDEMELEDDDDDQWLKLIDIE